MSTPNITIECRLKECEKATRESGLTEGCIVLNESREIRIRAVVSISPSGASELSLEIALLPAIFKSSADSDRAEKITKFVEDLESMGYAFGDRNHWPVIGTLRVRPFSVDANYSSLVFVIGMFFRSMSNEDAAMQGRLSCST